MIIKSEEEARSFLLYCYFIGYTDIRVKKISFSKYGKYNLSSINKEEKEKFEELFRAWRHENKVSNYLKSLGLLN